jgi:gluconate 5-dehydrogenase
MQDSLFDISDKVTLVSGGSRGIGKALAEGFAERGAKVIITSRDKATLEATAAAISTAQNKVAYEVCDVSRVANVRDAVRSVYEAYGRIDVLLNVAGVNIRQPACEFDEEQYDFVTNINQKGAYFVATEVAKVMKGQGGGAIVNVDSLNTYAPLKNVLPYAMTKNAVVALTRGLAMELSPSGIRVNSIAPGFILTDLSQKLWSDPTMQTWADANTPLGRLGEPQDMVGAAVFLASAASKFMSGQVVRVDGGFTAGFMWPIPEDGGQ